MVAIPNAATIVAGLFSSVIPAQQSGTCNPSGVTIPLSPAQQTALGAPSTPLVAVGLGVGVQNYTCSSNNVFVSAGAVAELFDVSCLATTNSGALSTIHNDVFNVWNGPDADGATIQQLIDVFPDALPADPVLSQHFFINNGAGGISPVWDFRATPKFQGVDNAVFVGKASANTPDADPTKNVAWLHLAKVSGDISDEVYRISTVGGVPPTSCVSGTTQDISVKYTSQYWFFGGSLGLGTK